jgi:hypothetical protein
MEAVMKASVLLAACGLLLVAACDGRAESRSEAFWRARRDRIEPPQLWSAQMTGPRPAGRAVMICTDRQLRNGFVRPQPEAAGQSCIGFGEVVATRSGSVFRCRIGERRFAVYSLVQGDRSRDFTSSFTIRPLDENGPEYRQVVRYRRLGACPAGWDLGDATDQQGRRVRVTAAQ